MSGGAGGWVCASGEVCGGWCWWWWGGGGASGVFGGCLWNEMVLLIRCVCVCVCVCVHVECPGVEAADGGSAYPQGRERGVGTDPA
jgi:hypothetical protein